MASSHLHPFGTVANCQTVYSLAVNEFFKTDATPGWPYLLSALSRKIEFRKLFLIWICATYNKLLTSVTISILLAVFAFMFQRGNTRVPFIFFLIRVLSWDSEPWRLVTSSWLG